RRRSLRLYVASDGLGAIHGEQVGQVRRLIIALNSAMEVLFVPLVVFLNWNTEPRRRWIIVIAAVIYVVHRAWTYLICAERRLATGTSPLSEADVGWYTRPPSHPQLSGNGTCYAELACQRDDGFWPSTGKETPRAE